MEEPLPMTCSSRSAWFAAAVLAVGALLAGCATPPSPSTPIPPAAAVPAAPPVAAEPAAPPASAPARAVAVVPATPPIVDSGPAASPPAIDPLRPSVRIDPFDATTQSDLWSRIRRGFAMPDLDTNLVRQREQWYSTRPDYVARMTERSSRYLFHIVEEVEKRGMPTELALLPFVESAFNPQAMSVAKASGMWQFIPSTGLDYDLRQNIFRDDRRDVLASTRAALDYLQKLYGMFNDWHLALAAYNWGEGSVQRAITRNERAGQPTDYLSLRMPEETRYYVPKLQAVKNLIARPEAFSIDLPPLENHPYFLSVPIERDIDVDLAARLADLPLDEFKSLNPQMNRPVILAAGTPQVLLPYDNANRFVRNHSKHRGPLASWTAWVAPKTLRPAEAAKQVGMTEAQLREVNNIPLRMLVKAGSTLVVPRGAERQTDVSEHIADNAMIALTPEAPALRRVAFRAGKKGSTVSAVARQYKVSPASVADWNKVGPQAVFKPGQNVVVYVPNRSAKSHPTRRPSKAPPARRQKR
jgi:membrane-bound lytic murein transglycosylase D